jgi:hypothetical protein
MLKHETSASWVLRHEPSFLTARLDCKLSVLRPVKLRLAIFHTHKQKFLIRKRIVQ